MSATISIITPTLNAAATVGEALGSVASQNLQGVESLLIDARSSDDTLDVARKFPGLIISSEADRGIYDAMNKGARMASGEWLLFLQADDWLPKGTLEAYREAITKFPAADFFCGGAEAVKKTESGWMTVWSVTDSASKTLSLANIALCEPMINARLIRREAFLKLRGFSLEYTLASDRDFLLRAVHSGILQQDVPKLTYRYRWHDGSSTLTEGNELTPRLSTENLKIAKKHFANADSVAREVLRQWHTRLTVQAAMNSLETPGWRGLLCALLDGVRVDPLWPARFSMEIIRSMPGFLARGGKTRSQLLSGRRE